MIAQYRRKIPQAFKLLSGPLFSGKSDAGIGDKLEFLFFIALWFFPELSMQCIRFDHNHHLEGIQQGDHLSSDSPDEKPSGHPRGLITAGSRSSNLSSCVRYVKARPLANTLAVIPDPPGWNGLDMLAFAFV
jgi:hypothetical protein